MARNYFIAVNAYRNSTSEGFANTWRIRRCHSLKQQRRILKDGLPVSDCEYLDNDGRRSRVCSTMGIRPATPAERREANRDLKWDRDAAPFIDTYADEDDGDGARQACLNKMAGL